MIVTCQIPYLQIIGIASGVLIGWIIGNIVADWLGL